MKEKIVNWRKKLQEVLSRMPSVRFDMHSYHHSLLYLNKNLSGQQMALIYFPLVINRNCRNVSLWEAQEAKKHVMFIIACECFSRELIKFRSTSNTLEFLFLIKYWA